MKRNVAILIFNDAEVLDFAGPFEVFSVTSQYPPEKRVQWYSHEGKYQYLLQEGQVCYHDYFVVKGALRQYQFHNNRERITQFAFENHWVSDWYSLLNKTSSDFCIDALENTEVLQIEKTSLDNLFEEIPKFGTYFRLIFQRAYTAQQQRTACMQKPSEDCYQDFVRMHNHLEQRVSQAQIASFMGITRESLSRIKKQSLLKQRK